MKGAPSFSHVVCHHPSHIHYNLGLSSKEDITIIDFVKRCSFNICHLEIPKSELLQDKNVSAQEHAPDTF